MTENFVLEMAKGINEPGQQRIDRFLELIKQANRIQKQLAKVLLEATEIQGELRKRHSTTDNGDNDSEGAAIFELTTPKNETLLVYDPFIVVPPRSVLAIGNDWFGEDENETLKCPEEIRVSAYARCPDDTGLPRKISRILCPEYEHGPCKVIENNRKCYTTCIYRTGDFADGEGWNFDGYEIDKIQLRLFRPAGIEM